MQIIAVVGPTATGKSDLALDLASALGNCEIINADAFAQYRGMDIGTAKVMPSERREIPHHMIDVLDPSETSTIGQYQVAGRSIISEIFARGNRPIVVGGSGLYVRALLDEMDLPGSSAAVRTQLEERLVAEGIEQLYMELQRCDSGAALKIGPHNARRIIRALEVIEITGKPYTASLPSQRYVYPTIQIGLDFNRAALDSRIELRVENMRQKGLLNEVKGLVEEPSVVGSADPSRAEEALASVSKPRGSFGRLGATASRAIGYAELLPVLQGDTSEDEAFQQIAANTRRLTRKQMGWFGRDPRVKWLDGANPNLLFKTLDYLESEPAAGIDPSQPQIRTPLGSISG